MRTNIMRAGELCLLIATLTTGCVEQADHGPTPASQALPSPLSELSTKPTKPIAPPFEALRSAIASRDWSAVKELLGEQKPSGFILRAGLIEGYQGSPIPLLVRHPSIPALDMLVDTSATPVLTLVDLEGASHTLTPELEPIEGQEQSARLVLSQSALPAQGVLIMSKPGVDPLDASGWLLRVAVADDRWACGDIETACEAGDYACILSEQGACSEQDLDFMALPRTGDEQGIDLLLAYAQLHGDVQDVALAELSDTFDEQGAWHKLTFSAPDGAPPVHVASYSVEGELTPLTWREREGGDYEVLAPAQGFTSGGLLIVDVSQEGKRFSALGVAQLPVQAQASLSWCRDWAISACVQVEDRITQNGSTLNRPVAGITVRPTAATIFDLGFFGRWNAVTTDANGCFQTSRTICGPGAELPRAIKLDVSLRNNTLSVSNPLAFESIVDGGFFRVFDDGFWPNRWPGSHNMGTMRFRPGNGGALGSQIRQRQALTWTTSRLVQAATLARDPWMRFQDPYVIHYPMLFMTGLALPPIWPNPTVILIGDGSFDELTTLVHETGHAWHYMHNSGIMPNIITSLINGWSTHNCQEDINIGFMEGFAEFFARQIMCEELFDATLCGGVYPDGARFNNDPSSRRGLLDEGDCNAEQGSGLTTPNRVVRNDDGVTHALQLLVADNFYQRNFQTFASTATQPNPLPALPAACQWYPFNNLSFWDVLRTFRANPALGLNTNFSIANPNGIEEFYDRFRLVNNLPTGFIQDRRARWDAALTNNPINMCRQPCAELSPWWNGTQRASTLNGQRCDLMAAPAGQTPFVSQNRYYLTERNICPLGSFDTANCQVHHPAPGTTAFIWSGNMYTTALPGNVCPAGTWDGANCLIAYTPAGTSAFIYNGGLYTTPIKSCSVGARESADRCYVGTPPAGATAQVTQNTFSYPRQ
jgi:hypothetical protein